LLPLVYAQNGRLPHTVSACALDAKIRAAVSLGEFIDDMKHDYSLAHLTVLSLTPPQVVDVAASARYRYVGLRITRVTPQEVLYDLARDRALMRETKASLASTGLS